MIEPLTYKEQDREFTLKALKAVKHVILVMNEIYCDFWNRDPQKIVENMNANIGLYLERFHSNTILGAVLNDRATAAGINDRMHITMPEGYSFNMETNMFEYSVPIPVIVPEPEPEQYVPADSYEYFEAVSDTEPQTIE